GQQRSNAGFGDRGSRVRRVNDGQGAIGFFHQPGPAGTEVANGHFVELFLEFLERTPGFVDGFTHSTGSSATTVRAQAVPVEGVVPDLCRVVEDTAGRGLDDLFQGFAFKLGTRNQVVQVGYVSVVVLA